MDCEKRKHSKKDLQRIKSLRLIDDNFMSICFDGYNEGAQLLLKIILGRDDLTVTEVRTQEKLTNVSGHSAVLDIYASDHNGDLYDIEIQRTDKGAIPKRARYHSSLLDVNILNKNEDYIELRESYVIFITENDVLGRNKPIYRIERLDEDDHVHFNDGSHIIYVNASVKTDETSLGRLMSDFYCTDAKDMNYKELADKVRYYKETEEGAKDMCDIWDDVRNEGLKEGKIEVAKELIKNGKLSLEDIAASTGFTVDEIRGLAEGKTA